MRALLLGSGAVGARVARQLVESDDVTRLVVAGGGALSREALVRAAGTKARDGGDTTTPDGVRADVVVLAGPAGTHVAPARDHLEAGRAIVSCSDAVEDVEGLLALDSEARARDLPVVIGAGFSPGYSCVLARHAATWFDRVDEVHVARSGTGGPSCAKQHHRALSGTALDWRDGDWQRRRGGSGRELCWFPDPIGAEDCYRAELPDALLLVPAFPGVERVTARLAASRRDRFTAHLPMLRRPHPEGLFGAVRVEVRGRRGSAQEVVVYGALDRPAVATGAVAALAARWAATRRIAPGAAGLASLGDALPFLGELSDIGIRAAAFEGAA